MQGNRKSVLVVSNDARLAEVRRRVLENAGYTVIEATRTNQVTEACQKQRVDLVMIGHSVPPSEKRQIWVEVRKHCKTPVLQLNDDGDAEPVETAAAFSHQSHTPSDLLEAVNQILREPRTAE